MSASTGILAVKIRYGSACSRVVSPSSNRFRVAFEGAFSSLESRRRLLALAALGRDERAAIAMRFGSLAAPTLARKEVGGLCDAATIAKNRTEACRRACWTDAGASDHSRMHRKNKLTPPSCSAAPFGPFPFWDAHNIDAAPVSRVLQFFFPPCALVVLCYQRACCAYLYRHCFFDAGRTSRQPPFDGLLMTSASARLSCSRTASARTRDASTTSADVLVMSSG